MSLSIYQFSVFDYFFIAISIFFFLVLKIRKEFFLKFSGVFLFITILLYQLLWILKGLDITDEGYMLTKSWYMLHGMWKENIDILWGSTLFNGLWLSIIGKPLVIWERIGVVLLISSTYLIIFQILRNYFDTIKLFIIVFITNLFATSQLVYTLNYNNIPVFFVLVAILFMVKYIETDKKYFLILLGIFLSMALFSRFTFAIFLILPFPYIFYQYYFLKKNKKDLLKSIYNSIIGISIGVIIAITILIFTNSLGVYIDKIILKFGAIGSSEIINSHSSSELISRYIEDFWQIATFTFVFSILYFVPVIISKIKINKYYKVLLYILLGLLLYYFADIKRDSIKWQYIILSFIFSSLMLYSFFSKFDKRKSILVIISLGFMLFSFIGSDNGILMTIYSGSCVLAFCIALLSIESLKTTINNFEVRFDIPVYIILGFIVFLIIINKNNDVYRDRPRNELVVPFKTEALNGIYSHELRVNAVDSMVLAFNQISKNDQKTLAFGSNPMFHFITNSKPFLSNPWFFSLDDFNKKINANEFPDFIVFSKKNPRSINWPIFNEIIYNNEDSIDFNFLQEFIINNNYELVYSNSMFDIYASIYSIYQKDGENIIDGKNDELLDYFVPYNGNTKIMLDSSIIHKSKYSFKILSAQDDEIHGILKPNLLENEVYIFEAWVYFTSPNTLWVQMGGSISLYSQNIEAEKWTKIKCIKKVSDSRLLIGIPNLPSGEYILIDEIALYNVKKIKTY